jgi:hypothetical protein
MKLVDSESYARAREEEAASAKKFAEAERMVWAAAYGASIAMTMDGTVNQGEMASRAADRAVKQMRLGRSYLVIP